MLWLGSSVAVAVVQTKAVALIQPLAWELSYATDVALKRKTETKTKPPCLLN